MTANYSQPRFATDKQLAKIVFTVKRDWGLSDNFKELVQQKDLSKLSIDQASRLIRYVTYYDENPRFITYAIQLLQLLPYSPDYLRMNNMTTCFRCGENIKDNDAYTVNDNDYCENCHDDLFVSWNREEK